MTGQKRTGSNAEKTLKISKKTKPRKKQTALRTHKCTFLHVFMCEELLVSILRALRAQKCNFPAYPCARKKAIVRFFPRAPHARTQLPGYVYARTCATFKLQVLRAQKNIKERGYRRKMQFPLPALRAQRRCSPNVIFLGEICH